MTLLMVLLTLAVVAGVIAVATGMIRGGLDEPAPTIPARGLPAEGITGRDVAALRFVQGFRGYRMDQVDAALDALAGEVDKLRAQVAQEKSARLQLAHGAAGPVEAPKPARKATGKKSSAAAGTSAGKATSARVTRARTAKRTDPTPSPSSTVSMYAPTVASGASSSNMDGDKKTRSVQELMAERDGVWSELSALGSVLDSVGTFA